MRRTSAVALFLFFSIFLNAQAPPKKKSAAKPQDAISAERLKAHMQFLSDDLLEGRATATRGHEIAARYVASQFEQIGLKPGANGSYFQQVKLRETEWVPEQSSFTWVLNGEERPQKLEAEWYGGADAKRPDTSVEGGAVFVGYGIVAPELNHDDYAGVDVKGKIVVIFWGAPSTWEATTKAYYTSGFMKAKFAAEHGAIGLVTIWSPELQRIYPWVRSLENSKLPNFRVYGPDDRTIMDTFDELKGGCAMTLEKGKELLSLAGKNLDSVFKDAQANKVQSFPLPVKFKIHTVSKFREATSPNVVGLLEGSDPKLKNEYVVYSAHLDHIGIAGDGEDKINNGAYDNASGSAALMEIARAFANAPQRPKRSILFVNVTGEEKGLLGAYYFSTHPTVPKDAMAANINMDELAALFPLKDVIGMGAEHSSIGADFNAAAKEVGLVPAPDPYPEETIFVRSDQFPFVRVGVPAIFTVPGLTSSDPKIDGKAVYGNWLEHLYHTPKDEMNLSFDWASNVKLVKLNFVIGNRIANAVDRARWNKGDIFQEKFGGPVQK